MPAPKAADDYESPLMMASRHVAEARRIVARQRARIVRLIAAGCDTADAERTLRIFSSTLEIFEQHERKLLEAAPPPLQRRALVSATGVGGSRLL
jgi:hypothetical protein